ncbi:MAG: FAD-binding oxidoreductase [bacterium]|nr:FAD-binding oxidoreductase [bacterium]
MTAYLEKLKDILKGDVEHSHDILDYYSTDGSIFQIKPEVVVYPKDTLDIQNLVRYVNELARAGHKISVTPRGKGTDQAGGPLNDGAILDTTRYMNHILEVGPDFVRVEPGVRYGELQAGLKKLGRYLPPYPASIELCTVGGAVANNSAGEKTVKYGATRKYVESLKVVLANGELVQTAPLNGYEVGAKKRQENFEGDIYRALDDLLVHNWELIKETRPHVSKNSTGYALAEVDRYNRFDLGQLLTGSQGTLGIITEITLKTAPVPQKVALLVGYFRDIHEAGAATLKLLHLKPSALEIVDKNLIMLVNEQNPDLLVGLVPAELPSIVLLAEFDDPEPGLIKKKVKAAKTILEKHTYHWVEKEKPEDQARLWKLRRSAAAVMWTIPGVAKALPIIEDGTVNAALLPDFFEKAYELFKKYDLQIAVWGHAGDADLHMQPFMNLSSEKDRKKIFDLTDDFYKMVIELGGTTSGEHNDGLMRSPWLKELYGEEMYRLFERVKKIFDPHGILNPGKKTGVSLEQLKKLLRDEYSMKHLVADKEQVNR